MRTLLSFSTSLLAVVALAGCTPKEFEQRKLNDGTYAFTCQLPMDECVRKVQNACEHQRFRILEGTSETRLRDAPPFEKAYHTSRLRLECTHDGADVLLSIDKGGAPASKAAPKSSCSAGETRACVGAAACKGGQTCLPDGSGFGACDCGPAPAPPASAAPPAPPPEAVTPPTSSSAAPVSPEPAPAPTVPGAMPSAQPLTR